jgi:hypothetical protein
MLGGPACRPGCGDFPQTAANVFLVTPSCFGITSLRVAIGEMNLSGQRNLAMITRNACRLAGEIPSACHRVFGLIATSTRTAGTRPYSTGRGMPRPGVPAADADEEVKGSTRVATGEQDYEPDVDQYKRCSDVQEDQHDPVWDGQQPFHQRKQPVQIIDHVRVVRIKVHRLLFVRRGVFVRCQQKLHGDAGMEAEQLNVEVPPPARVLLPEHDHQKRRDDDDP